MQNAQWLQQQALAQQQALKQQPSLIKNSNDPSCTQGTVTVKQEAPEVSKNQVPQSVCQNLLSAGQKRSIEQSSCSDRTTSNESNSLSSLLEQPMKQPKFEMDSEVVMSILNGSIKNNNSSSSSSTESSPKRSVSVLLKSDSGNESDESRNKTISTENEAPDFSKIISDLKGDAPDFSGVTPSLNTSSEQIFKDLINSLPL